ncbi:MAG: hypothetical protein NT070_10325 [Cyanobacteria bacterium]|nr:hypothetical protein [Cyanobacteriota bacterium]
MNRKSKDGYWFAIAIGHILSCNNFNLNFHSTMRQYCHASTL